ncbi:MAG: tRNA-dihydrouridine synthase family protein [Deltaproteobacteria bacterium]|nr:tRNA-dihydrouridine synthase family protein [Deltaproteobacteria bacterium]
MIQPGPLHIKNLKVDPPLILAPMCGLSHTVLRQLVVEYTGCGLFYSEMLSARALPLESPNSSPWLRCTERERPLIYQLLVSHPTELAAAIEKIESCGADGLDLNMGCTTALITKRGGGIALMKDLKRAEAIVSASRSATDLPLTAKIRLGWSLDWGTLKEFCSMLQDSGVDAISVHPRLKQDRLKRPARWEYIGRIKELLDIPIIGNGDIDSPESAMRMFKLTGCDAVMIGRAAVGRPWLFRQIATSISPQAYPKSPPVPSEAFNRFVSLLESCFEPEYAFPLLKKFTFYFAQNYAFGHTLWRLVHNASSLTKAAALANDFFSTQAATG